MKFTKRGIEGRREEGGEVGERKRRILPVGEVPRKEYYSLFSSVCFWALLSGSVNANTIK